MFTFLENIHDLQESIHAFQENKSTFSEIQRNDYLIISPLNFRSSVSEIFVS